MRAVDADRIALDAAAGGAEIALWKAGVKTFDAARANGNTVAPNRRAALWRATAGGYR
ncbi:hypothetical protein N1F89_02795 [Aquibium sp. A9E412]|uniref:hypothetical protein n=1 Tax=Aquibium sp. A9E412 TaxID=2976767 RepID=UPI0025B1D372|nr:hypothetical protein [Aquibium sp. A9E412]MDN2565138.1 hypothetical protein [Aquibium sp. A9E412]